MRIGVYPPATVSNCASMLADLGHEGLAAISIRHCRILRADPSSVNGCLASRLAGRACDAPLTLEPLPVPAGLTARARPEARP